MRNNNKVTGIGGTRTNEILWNSFGLELRNKDEEDDEEDRSDGYVRNRQHILIKLALS